MKMRALRPFLGGLAALAAATPPLEAGHYTWSTAGPETGLIFQIAIPAAKWRLNERHLASGCANRPPFFAAPE
jgi:hypothetical protein